MNRLTQLPGGLSAPEDDGVCDHLDGARLPSVSVESTAGRFVNLSSLQGTPVLYCYPMTGQPDVPLPDGWDQIPGARGCTPQSCSNRDHHLELKAFGTEVYGASTQSSKYQQEAVQRLHPPFGLLSDANLSLVGALRLPTFEIGGRRLTQARPYGKSDFVEKITKMALKYYHEN